MSQGKTRAAALLPALGTGLFIFFALESAIARRVGLDLFLPAADGAFLPGRLARLGAALVLGFALVLTDRGRSLGRALDRLCGRDRGRWAVSAAVTALLFLWTLRVTVLSYMTMDEVSFLQAIAQVPEKGLAALHNTLAHSAQENASSISLPLCWFIGQFYRLDPDGYWYLGYHLAMLLAGFTVIGRCILLKTDARRWPAAAGCVLYAVLYAGALLYAASRIAFTVTAAVAGTAASALMLCRHQESGRAGRVRCDILSGGLMVLCCMQRRATGYCLLCFWALALAYQVLKNALAGREELKKRLSGLVLCLAATLALIGGVFATVGLECDEDYRQSEYYRSLVGDYLKESLTTEQYAQAGVSPELSTMIRGWCFMDERVTTDLFRQLADIYYADLESQPAEPLPSRLGEMVSELAATLWEDPCMRWQTGALLSLTLLGLAAFIRRGRRQWPEFLCGLCAAGGAALLLLYLVKDGRFMIRVFLSISIPTLVMILLTALSVPPEGADVPRSRRTAARTMGGICAGAMAVFCALGLYATPHAAETVSHDDVFALQAATEAFAAANSDKIIVSSVYDHHDINTDPLHPLDTYPDNIIPWGYCGDLAKDPADRLYADDLFRDDVLFMVDQPNSIFCMLQYLSVDHGPVQALQIARLPMGVLVNRVEKIAPDLPDFTGWYERSGLEFYFRDGEAVTGEQTIDGVGYQFTPPGAISPFVVDGDMFTLRAYSLIRPEDDAS